MENYIMSDESLTQSSNQVKEIFLNKMLEEKNITKEQFDVMCKYSIVIAKKSILGRWWDKLWKKGEEKESVIFVAKILD